MDKRAEGEGNLGHCRRTPPALPVVLNADASQLIGVIAERVNQHGYAEWEREFRLYEAERGDWPLTDEHELDGE
jgi:hypothetical protein